MNLKDAFRFQNRLNAFISELDTILTADANTTKTEKTHLRSRVMAEATDETVFEVPTSAYADRVTELAEFLLFLLAEKEKISAAIQNAKRSLPIDIDSETGLNAYRHSTMTLFQHMVDLRSSETVLSNAGFGYRFNADGNQIAYKCDLKKVVTINFDRNLIRKHLNELNKKSDEISAEIDRCIVNTEVDYEKPFDVNDSFADVFDSFLEKVTA